MSTASADDILALTLLGASQSAILGLLYAHPGESFYLREIVETTGLGMGHIQRELQKLSNAGILLREERGRHVYFQANPACPLFPELRGIVRKTLGAPTVLRQVFRPLMKKINAAFIYGSVARGDEHAASDLDLMVIGAATFAEVAAAARKAESTLRRPINPTVYPPAEFHDKVKAQNHFLTSVLKREKTFILGGDHELGTLLAQQLDPPPRILARRNQKPPRHRRS
jgi:predicted nucleotidyltransferase/DNA-binding transcriptional ArsR family regulator